MLTAAPGAAYLLAGLSLVFGITTPGFATPANLTNVVLQAAVLTILALGMTLVMLTEGIDLSMGPVLGLTGVAAGLLLAGGRPLALAMALALSIGVAFGVMNGVLVAWVGLPAFVVTLGTFGMAQSLAMVLTEGNSVTGLPGVVRWFNDGMLLGMPVPVWATVALFALTWLLLHRTRFGRYVFAIGGNRRALALMGVRVRAWHVAVYALAGLLTALASFIMTARMNAAHPTIGIGLEFDAIAAAVLGGTAFEGGRGGIAGTVLGALAVGVLRNGLNLVGISTEWQVAVVGVVIIGSVGVDALRGLA
ncbi:MAG TPA: ABC transporter permease [Methylomirabilota bacterium]|jgi:ribose transport system permease protein|nr:ABC transporter permease [Methylomirabilota bacterium]